MAVDVWVVDTSALLQVRLAHDPADQIAIFKGLHDMAVDGRLAVTRRVLNECNGQYFDLPTGWASVVKQRARHPLDPGDEHVQTVMAAAPNVIEADNDRDPADPYVLAQALQLREDESEVCVVTQDFVDRLPKKISMATAADRLDLAWRQLQPFLSDVGLP